MWHNIPKQTQLSVVWGRWERFSASSERATRRGGLSLGQRGKEVQSLERCGHFGTMKGASLGVKAKQKEGRKWDPEGKQHHWTPEPNQPWISPHLWPFQLCDPENRLYFPANESRDGWLFINGAIETRRGKNINSCQLTTKSRHTVKAIGPAWQCVKWLSSPSARRQIVLKVRPRFDCKWRWIHSPNKSMLKSGPL